jgi:hypothetical protein
LISAWARSSGTDRAAGARRRPAAILPALAAALLLSHGLAAGGPAPEKRLTPDEQREVAALLEQFRGPAFPEARQKVADRLLEIGGPAPRQLLPVVQAVAAPILEDYGKAYLAAARPAYLAKVEAAGADQVRALRRQVLGLRSNLSRAGLQREAEPALGRLHVLLYLTPQDVGAQSAEVRRRRELVLALDAIGRRCQDYYDRPPPGRPGRPGAWRPSRGGLADRLAREEQWVALLALSDNDRDVMVLGNNRKAEPSLLPPEVLGVRDANRMRLLLGVGAMAIDLKLCQAARDHAETMARLGFVSHQSPIEGKRLPWDRAARFGTTCQSENVSYGGTSAPAVVRRWFLSPEHHVNLLNRDYYRCGFGNSGQYWVLMFGR